MYIACHEKIFQQMNNLNADGCVGIDMSTYLRYFLNRTDVSSLRTAVQICESQFSYSTIFHTCALYLTSMVNKPPATKRVHIAAAATKVHGIKL